MIGGKPGQEQPGWQHRLLAGYQQTEAVYQLIGKGELVAYKDGRARRVTMQSIRDRVAIIDYLTDRLISEGDRTLSITIWTHPI